LRRAGEQVAIVIHILVGEEEVEVLRFDAEPGARRAKVYDSWPAKEMRARLLETLRRRVGTDQEALRIIDALAGALDLSELRGFDTKLHPDFSRSRSTTTL
jgi:hypothetical protein